MRGGQGRGYSPPRAPAIVTVSSPAAMRFLALLLAAQMVASPDTVPPYLTFPEPGLDDPAAYQGYATRVFRDAKGNAFQVYVNGRIGRVVNLWADAAEQRRHLRLLGARSAGELRARLAPRVSARARDGTWAVRVEQVSFDGRSHLSVAVEGDARETVMTRTARSLIIRSRSGRPVRLTVRVTTDAPALSPLTRAEIFNDDFRRFVAAVRADTAHPLRFRRLEREVRGVELLCYREKLMAGLPNFATYFGRDMLMTALLMQPVWAPAMPQHVIASALRKLSPDGDVSHEEALGGQAIRENAAEYNRLVRAGQLARARAVLGNLQAVRENYVMVDDDFQLPVVAARYLA